LQNEQSHGDTQNVVYCALLEKNLTLQEAMEYVAGMVRTRINKFQVSRKALPSYGLDSDVPLFLRGLEYWLSGSMHWYYHSKRSMPVYLLFPSLILIQQVISKLSLGATGLLLISTHE
jgi:hypothetical protein